MGLTGALIPDEILKAPVLIKGLELFYVAFFDLCSERNFGFSGLGPIPFFSIVNYAKFYNFDTEQTEMLLFFIQKMDEAFLKENSKKILK